ncbi:PEP-CTERM sorting domain-containing protein [Thiobacillus sp.]
MKMKRINILAAMCALCTISGTAAAVPITDPAGDFLATYAASGRPLGADLDVVAAEVIYHPGSHQFEFIGTTAGAIGTTPAAGSESVLYVWGVDRGAGTERFLAGSPSIGDGVAFDSVVILRPNGTGAITLFGPGGPMATPLPAGTALINGNTISAFLDETLLPTQGEAFSDYTWNLWPRFGAGDNAQISDFAPNAASGAIDAANARVTVPEPSSLALLGIGALALIRRRQKR